MGAVRTSLKLFEFVMLLYALSVPLTCAQVPDTRIQKILSVEAELTRAELESLRKPSVVAKLLTSGNDREVAVFGAVRVNAPLELILLKFQETMARQNKKSILALGNFSPDPLLTDLKDIELSESDISALKACRVGNCKLKLSAVMIERFQKEIDWSSPDHVAKANELFRQMLLDYVRDYDARGDSALLEIRNSRDTLLLRDEYNTLFSGLIGIEDLTPEFSSFLTNFPREDLPNIRQSYNWSKTDFGLKPTITITQTVTFLGGDRIVSLTKQIFATRYIDSSLWMTALVKVADPTGDYNLLLYTNRSRSSSLDGLMSGLKRSIVEREALEKITPLLEETKAYAEAAHKKSGEIQSDTDAPTSPNYSFYLVGAAAIIAVLGLLFLITRRLTKI